LGDSRKASDDGQQVVEIVRDSTRQLPDRFHLLRLTELFLESVPVRLVAHDRSHADHLAVGSADREQRERELDAIAVLTDPTDLALHALASPDAPPQLASLRFLLAGRQDPERAPTEHLGGGVAVDALGGVVPDNDLSVQVDGHRIARGLDDRREQPHRPLRRDLVGEVAEVVADERRPARPIQPRDRQLDRNSAPSARIALISSRLPRIVESPVAMQRASARR
jgi:hypothetical protein